MGAFLLLETVLVLVLVLVMVSLAEAWVLALEEAQGQETDRHMGPLVLSWAWLVSALHMVLLLRGCDSQTRDNAGWAADGNACHPARDGESSHSRNHPLWLKVQAHHKAPLQVREQALQLQELLLKVMQQVMQQEKP